MNTTLNAELETLNLNGTGACLAVHRSSFIVQRFPAFTLIELMVSIAIIVVLMVGVTKVFQYTSQAVSANQQLSSMIRDDRAAQATLKKDFDSYAADGPALLIRNEAQIAFRNRQDELADRNSDVRDWEPLNDGNALMAMPAVPSQRTRRIDRLGYFVRGVFPRQTGNDGTFVAPMTTNEAYIWLGHLCLAHPQGTFYLNGATSGTKTNPGAGSFSSNPQNYYASQWALGRMSLLLRDPTGASDNPPISVGTIDLGTPGSPNYQHFIFRNAGVADPEYMFPFNWQSRASDLSGKELLDCRYDLIGSNFTKFATILKNFTGVLWQVGNIYQAETAPSSGFPTPTYYRGRVYTVNSAHTANAGNAPPLDGSSSSEWQAYDPNRSDWWTVMNMSVRFECNPFVIRPISSASYAQQVPVFMQNCSSFTVEYAGDFLKQDADPGSDAYGYVQDCYDNPDQNPNITHTDGQTDFIVTWNDRNGNGKIDNTPAERLTVQRQIRWYGMPRDTNGDNIVLGYRETSTVKRRPQELVDVVPLRDVVMTINASVNDGVAGVATNAAYYELSNFYWGVPFEKFQHDNTAPTSNSLPLRTGGYYANLITDPANTGGMQPGDFYQCAWGPYDTVRPTMIRIIMTLDDPQGRLQEGQTFEYVFKLQK